VPKAVQNLTNLQSLVLWQNSLSGVADNLDLRPLAKLQTLNLAKNEGIEDPPALCRYLARHLPAACNLYI